MRARMIAPTTIPAIEGPERDDFLVAGAEGEGLAALGEVGAAVGGVAGVAGVAGAVVVVGPAVGVEAVGVAATVGEETGVV